MSATNPNIVWIDLETTGLDPYEGLPLEVALVITDSDLKPISWCGSALEWPIKQVRNSLNPITLAMHSSNGLLHEIEYGPYVESAKAMDAIMSRLISKVYLTSHAGSLSPLAGNTIGFDREWLKVWFPKTFNLLHYRNVDVSSIKELVARWAPDFTYEKGEETHRAGADIHASIAELAYYRRLLFTENLV
jgi:oligoribonuclease